MKLNPEQLNIEQSLKSLKTLKPDTEFLSSFRNILVARIAHETPIQHPVFFPVIRRFAIALTSLLVIIGSVGLGVSYASQSNDPDSLWYKIKIATEKIQLSLVENDPLESAALSAKFAQHRLKELAAIDQDSRAQINRENVLKFYYQNITSLQTALQDISGEPTRQTLNDLLALEGQINVLDQTIETYGLETDAPTSTILEAQSISRFTKNIIQTMSLQYATVLDIKIEDEHGTSRISALYERIANRFVSLSDTWRPRFQEKINRIVADETLSPEKAPTYSFTEDEAKIVNILNKAKTQLGEIKIIIESETPSTSQIMEIAGILLEIDRELATIEVLLQ